MRRFKGRGDFLDYERLNVLRDAAIEKRKLMPDIVWEKAEKAFIIEYTHQSTAIEGNTLSLAEVKLILEDGISVGGKPLRETYEVANHEKAYAFVKRLIESGRKLDEGAIKDIHHLLMENIMPGGIYRDCDARITGSAYKPPSANDAFYRMKSFAADLYARDAGSAVYFAAWTHAEFVNIHPFADGNGRTARLLMNFRLMEGGFMPITILPESRLIYYDALEAYDLDGDLFPLTEMIFLEEKGRLEEFLGF
jgi:Fic family protein